MQEHIYNRILMRTDPWFLSFSEHAPKARIRLFCFPYAGGSATLFRLWMKELPADCTLHAVQLPGRGFRLHESPYTQMEPLITVLTEAIAPLLDRPYALFGHSLGARIAFELFRSLRQKGYAPPIVFFPSARIAPQLVNPRPKISHLPSDDFLAEIAKRGGTPKELLASQEFMKMIEPALRADFMLSEHTPYVPEQPLICPIHAFGSGDDPYTSVDELTAWELQTTADFRLTLLPGGHFFIHDQWQAMIRQMTVLLSR